MSSYGKSTTAGKFQPKPKGKQVPHAGLYILTKDGSNVTQWREALRAYAKASLNGVGREFSKGIKLVREKPTLANLHDEFPELAEANLQVMLQQEIAQHLKLKRGDDNDRGTLCAVIEQTTSDEGLGRVKNLGEYLDINEREDPIDLESLVISEHTLMMHHTSPRETKYVAQVRYSRIVQKPGQTDEDFLEKFKLARANMTFLQILTRMTTLCTFS